MTKPVLPTFITVGAMKCGTTSLHSYLDRHPDTSMSDPKEVNFFSGGNVNQSLEWYSSLFDPSKPARGESSQNYSKGHHDWYKGAPEKIKALIPNVKLIYLVRDPIERYFSHMHENYYVGSRADRKYSRTHDNYVLTGLYHYQLSFFLEHFSIDQIKVIDIRDLKLRRQEVMNSVFEFLDLPALRDETFDYRANETRTRVAPLFLRSSLPIRAMRKIAPGPTDAFLQSDFIGEAFKPRNTLERMSSSERAKLVSRFKPDADKLRNLLDRDFAHWSV